MVGLIVVAVPILNDGPCFQHGCGITITAIHHSRVNWRVSQDRDLLQGPGQRMAVGLLDDRNRAETAIRTPRRPGRCGR